MQNDPTLEHALDPFEIERMLAFAREPKNPTPEEMRAAAEAGRAAGAARRPFRAVEYCAAPVPALP